MDHHVHRAITIGLRSRGVEVITAREDNAHTLNDPMLLERASSLSRVLFTQDEDLLTEAARCQQQDKHFSGVIYAHQMNVSIGTCINNLDLICKVCEPIEMENMVLFLPL
jgi:predicted nuclease of predicted toxin-antitoxin system